MLQLLYSPVARDHKRLLLQGAAPQRNSQGRAGEEAPHTSGAVLRCARLASWQAEHEDARLLPQEEGSNERCP